jgi:AcrR family transcriptional regulator
MTNPKSVKRKIDEETKARLETVVKNLFSQKDFHQVNMREIAKKAGVGLNTVYLYYESKERLLFSFIDEWNQGLDRRLEEHLQGLEDPKEKIRKIIWVLLDFYERNPDIGQILLLTVPFKTWSTDESFKAKNLFDRISAVFDDGRQKGVFDAGLSARCMFDVLFGIIHRTVYMWLYQDRSESLTSRAGLFYDILWRVIRKPA